MNNFTPDDMIMVNTPALGTASQQITDSNQRLEKVYEDACEVWDNLLNNWEGDTANAYQLADITTRSMVNRLEGVFDVTAQNLINFSDASTNTDQLALEAATVLDVPN